MPRHTTAFNGLCPVGCFLAFGLFSVNAIRTSIAVADDHGSWAINSPAAAPTSEQIEFFEKRVRPIFVNSCGHCHDGEEHKSDLKLNSRDAILRGGKHGAAAVPGKPEASLLIHAVRRDGKLKMPKDGDALPAAQIEVLERWIAMGMPWPEKGAGVSGTASFTAEQQNYWAFQPVGKVAPPRVKEESWVRTDVDRFILAALEAKGLSPAPPADKRTLLRRATFDLIGLPPTPEEIDAFLKDGSPDAFAKVVGRLLASPHYGERWGRHWLDTIRYADSSGRVSDFPEIWRYRDWVTDSFNRDLPYGRFIALQFAGDLIQPADKNFVDKDALVATGLLAIAQFDPGNVDPRLMNAEYVDDQIDVVGRAVLGLTLACARCHDHKFDPILTDDYYALAGIFFNSRVIANLQADPPRLRAPLLPKIDADRIIAARDARKKRIAELEKAIKELAKAKAGPTSVAATVPATDSIGPPMLTDAQRLAALKADLERVKAEPEPELPEAVVVVEGGQADGDFASVHDTPVYIRGDPHRPGKVVPRGFPRVLAGDRQPPITHGSGRLDLARWLASPDNPLPSRVMVNRIWQHHFGEGIVRTPNNFGKLGDRPSNPALLDFLARRFLDSGGSMKTIHRLIMLSATYQQCDRAPADTLARDPDNALFGRMNRRRLEAEAIRDNLLAVAGRLDLSMGGIGFRDLNTPRRTHYLKTVRSETVPGGYGLLFDRPDPSLISERRAVSTGAPQALFMLNDPFVVAQAKALAERVAKEAVGKDEEAKIRRLYLLAFGREPAQQEIEIGTKLLSEAGTTNPWERYCQVILCANEFVYVD
jgi:hypothetical protein